MHSQDPKKSKGETVKAAEFAACPPLRAEAPPQEHRAELQLGIFHRANQAKGKSKSGKLQFYTPSCSSKSWQEFMLT